MKLDLSKSFDVQKAQEKLDRHIKRGEQIEIKLFRKKRTLKQNAYLHILFTIFGVEFGYSIEEAKTVVKREFGFYYEKNGMKFLRSTADLNTEELSSFIERFRNFSLEQGCVLPTAEEYLVNQFAIDSYTQRQSMENMC